MQVNPEGSRWVDKIPAVSPRPVEMQVLCLGLSRTSTMSLYTALNKLGYQTYHMLVAGDGQNMKDSHHQSWLEGLMIKTYGRGKPFGRAEFDKILGRYSAITDIPCVMFVDELLDAYPDAKVIVTTRDVDKWIPSIEHSFYKILSWRWWMALSAVHEKLGAYTELLRQCLTIWAGGNYQDRDGLREGFARHYQHLREVLPEKKRDFIEFRPEMGWEPICKLLDKPIPDEPYPRVNEGSYAANLHIPLFWVIFLSYFKWPAVAALGGGLGWAAWLRYS